MNSVVEPAGGLFRLSLKEALFIGFCAVFAVLARMMLRLHLHISGHAMLVTVFFLLLARGSVRYRLAASFAGLLAGSASLFLGFAKSGPFMLVKYLAVALIIDVAGLLLPGLFRNYVLCALVGGCAGATKFFTAYSVNYLAGMDRTVNLQGSLLEAAGAILFGVLGGLLVPVVIRRLQAYGVIS